MEVLLWTVVIFFARVVDVGLGTIRVQFIMRRQKLLAALIGFVEILIFILVVSRVIQDIEYWSYVLAYAAGFATGTLVGIYLSEKFTRRILQVTIICNGSWHEVEAAVREAGFALTRYEGMGRDGPVEVIEVVCTARHMPRLTQVVLAADSHAFLYTQELAGLQGGYVYGLKGKTT
jgi:uncharacterized protein YebE (UPF0316 family)